MKKKLQNTLQDKVEKDDENILEPKEKKGSLQPILQILKETAKKFNSLDQEASIAIHKKRDTALYAQKREARAKLLINLPSLLSGMLQNIDSEAKKTIIRNTEYFAEIAQEALDNKNNFALAGLLTQQGSKNEDKNDLEELIASLEE